MGVSFKECDEIIEICNKYGVACKITGAGNGGCCLGFIYNE